jgi:hypothetical protein
MIASSRGGLSVLGGSRTKRARYILGYVHFFPVDTRWRGPSPPEESGFEALRIPFSATPTHSAGADIPGAVAPCGPGCHSKQTESNEQ